MIEWNKHYYWKNTSGKIHKLKNYVIDYNKTSNNVSYVTLQWIYSSRLVRNNGIAMKALTLLTLKQLIFY